MGICLNCFKKDTQKVELLNSDPFAASIQLASGQGNCKAQLFDTINQKEVLITNIYQFINPPIGQGTFGEVRKGIHKASGIVRAIKIVHKAQCSEEHQQRILNEVQTLKKLDHPNIIKIFEFYQDQDNFYIVTEMCTGGELFDKFENQNVFNEKEAVNVMKQLLSALYYCHSQNIVHRDLKPDNLLFESQQSNANIKVIDFGTCKFIHEKEFLTEKIGSPYYIAPEVIKRRYNTKGDIWSCGVILYFLLSGQPPFEGKNEQQLFDRIQKGRISFDSEIWQKVSDEGKSLIKRMLEVEPAKRFSAQQCLADPWIRKYSYRDSIAEPMVQRALENMKTFRTELRLQEAVFIYMVNYLTSRDEKHALLHIFQQLDLNGDGILTYEELVTGYKNIVGKEQVEEEVKAIMKSVDKNESGFIDYSEFVAASINRKSVLSKHRLEAAFKTFDKDGNGKLSISELKEIFGGGKIPDEVWREIVKEVDQDGDGDITLEEFKTMMLKLRQEDPIEEF